MLEEKRVVLSLSGHDKDRLYVVVAVEDGFCYIADGKRRTLAKPKRKNPRHLRKTGWTLQGEEMGTDRALRRTLAQLEKAANGRSSIREESCPCQNKT